MQFKMKAFVAKVTWMLPCVNQETSSAIGLLVAKGIMTSFPPSINLDKLGAQFLPIWRP